MLKALRMKTVPVSMGSGVAMEKSNKVLRSSFAPFVSFVSLVCLTPPAPLTNAWNTHPSVKPDLTNVRQGRSITSSLLKLMRMPFDNLANRDVEGARHLISEHYPRGVCRHIGSLCLRVHRDVDCDALLTLVLLLLF